MKQPPSPAELAAVIAALDLPDFGRITIHFESNKPVRAVVETSVLLKPREASNGR